MQCTPHDAAFGIQLQENYSHKYNFSNESVNYLYDWLLSYDGRLVNGDASEPLDCLGLNSKHTGSQLNPDSLKANCIVFTVPFKLANSCIP